jgi:plastocyanin
MLIEKGGWVMKREKSAVIIILLISFFCFPRIIFAVEEKIEEIKIINRVVRVSHQEGVMPATLTSKPGTTVIWVNQSRTPVEILFLDKKVVLACGSPVNFFVGKNGAYESGKIPFGGTASLCFTEKGKYEYIFRSSSTFYPLRDKDYRGVIVIK